MSLLKDLRQRRVVQIVIAYLAGGWIALEVVSQVVEHGMLPHLVYALALGWYVAGIAAALIFGWFHGEKGAQRAPLVEVVLLGALAVVVLGFSGQTAWRHYQRHQAILSAAEGGLDPRRVAVLYFRDITRGGGLQHVADAFSEDLIEELTSVRELDLVSANGVAPFRESDESIDQIASEVSAGTIIDGAVERAGGDARIHLRIFDGASGTEFHRSSLSRPLEDVFGLQGEVTREVARLLREWLGEEIRLRAHARGTDDPKVWAIVQRAEKARKDARREDTERRPEEADALLLQADSLLALAEALDEEWVEPTTLRSWTEYRRSRLAFDYQLGMDRILGPALAALGHAERALDRNHSDAEALEARGTARYWLWHIRHYRPEVQPEKQERLFLDARADLERAVGLDPTLASAYTTLSHLYLNCADRTMSAVALAAQRAYEEDAFLETAPIVLLRLVDAYSNLEQFADARKWCAEGGRRFPDQPAFTQCQLRLMLAPGAAPDPDLALLLATRLDSLAVTPEQRAWQRVWSDLIFAGVLCKAGLRDSARVVLDRAHAEQRRIAAELDPRQDLLSIEAYARHLAEQDERAIELLHQYVAVNPGHSFDPAGGLHWWWRELSHHPRFRELVALRSGGS